MNSKFKKVTRNCVENINTGMSISKNVYSRHDFIHLVLYRHVILLSVLVLTAYTKCFFCRLRWLLNQDDKQLKNQILIACCDDKTLTKHALFYVFSQDFLPKQESFPELQPPLKWRLCRTEYEIRNKTWIYLKLFILLSLSWPHTLTPLFLFSVGVSVTSVALLRLFSKAPIERTLAGMADVFKMLVLRDYNQYTIVLHSNTGWPVLWPTNPQ